jgi:hypothetical protein
VLWLLPAVFLSFGFGQLFKWSQRKNHKAPVVIATNYLVLAGCLFCYFLLRDDLSTSPQALLIGVITGIFFIASMLVMTHALTHIDSAPTLTSFRLAVVAPIFVGAFLWDETVTGRQVAGCVAALTSLLLLSWRPGETSRGRSLYLVAAIFILQGLSMCCLHWVHHAGLDEERLHVLMITAATAGILGSLFVAVRRIPVQAPTALVGAGIGVFNLVTLSISLTALSQIQGTIFFPINGCGVVLLDNLFSHFIWKEPLGRTGFLGACLGALAMVLII